MAAMRQASAGGGEETGDHVGGLVGSSQSSGSIIGSYANGDAGGGEGTSDNVGGLTPRTRRAAAVHHRRYGFGNRLW